MLFFGRNHVASYESPAVYYSFAFSLPEGTDIFKLTDELLRRDVAESAAISGSAELSFSYRFERKRKAQILIRDLASFEAVIDGSLTLRRWIREHPKRSIWLARSLPKPTFRLLRRKLAGMLLRRPERASKAEPNGDFEKFREIAKEADLEMLNLGLFSGLASVVDSQLFAPSYLATAPYIRLKLSAIHVESESWTDNVLELFLLLHRCGTAILTFAAVPGQRTTDELLKLSVSAAVRIKRTTFPLSLGRLMALGKQHDSDQQLSMNGQEWRDVVWNEPMPLQSLFEGYAELFCQLATRKGSLGEWMCYTTLFVDGLYCCGSKEKWLKYHSADLAGLVMRNTDYTTTKKSMIAEALSFDFALHEHESDYFEQGSAVLVKWQFAPGIERSSPNRHFKTTALVEGELVRYWQLRALERHLSVAEWKQSNLEEIQRKLITGLEEYRGSKVVFGTARDIEKHLSKSMDLDRTYQQILDRIDAIQRLMDTRTASVASRRNLLFAGISAAAAVLFGMSAISDLLNVTSKVDVHRFPGVLARPLDHFARLRSNGEWELYLLLVVAVCAASAAAFFAKVAIGRRSIAKSFGVEWKTISYGTHSTSSGAHEGEIDGPTPRSQ